MTKKAPIRLLAGTATVHGDDMAERIVINTFCTECGPNVSVDEDGCCNTCGGWAMGEYVGMVDEMARLLGRMLEAHKASSVDWPAMGEAERLLKDNNLI